MSDAQAGSWKPMIPAVAGAALMLWLAGAPLESKQLAVGGALIEPTGTVDAFPQRFLWTPVDGADRYEISVGEIGGDLLFRQRGVSTVLDIEFDADSAPPPGRYGWEVRALDGDRLVGTAAASFEFVPPEE